MALKLQASFGTQLTLVALVMIAAIGLLSSLLANVPVAAASILMVKGYLVAAEVVPDAALAEQFTQWPAATIPVFVGMMFRRNARRQCHPHRRIGQHRGRRHLRARGQAGHVRHIYALWTRRSPWPSSRRRRSMSSC
ncbi:hypothetical protein ACU4GD_42000 [Cupriavidus basilensis]